MHLLTILWLFYLTQKRNRYVERMKKRENVRWSKNSYGKTTPLIKYPYSINNIYTYYSSIKIIINIRRNIYKFLSCYSNDDDITCIVLCFVGRYLIIYIISRTHSTTKGKTGIKIKRSIYRKCKTQNEIKLHDVSQRHNIALHLLRKL